MIGRTGLVGYKRTLSIKLQRIASIKYRNRIRLTDKEQNDSKQMLDRAPFLDQLGFVLT
jgi:hypothetical protein